MVTPKMQGRGHTYQGIELMCLAGPGREGDQGSYDWTTKGYKALCD